MHLADLACLSSEEVCDYELTHSHRSRDCAYHTFDAYRVRSEISVDALTVMKHWAHVFMYKAL